MATREEYRKKYGATTLGQTGTAQTQKSISDGGVTREDYAKKYGMTTGLGRTNSSGFRRTAMQEAAEGFANSLRSQNQFRGQYTPPDWESAVEAGKQKKSVLSTPYVLDPTKDDIPTMLKGYGDELKLAKYRKNYNLSYMTDDEKNNYYYLVGKYGLESGDNYLKQINDSLKQRNAKDIEETGKKVGKTDPLTGILGNVIGSVTSGVGYLQDVADTVRGKEIDRNNVGHRMSGLENATREGLKEAARENIADSSATDFAVDTGLSMAQSLARLPFGYAGLGIAGLSAATGAEEDALSQDVSAKKALAQGTAQGIAEGLFEKFSLGNLKSMQSVPVYSWKDVAKNIAKQMGTEASEEMATEATNALTDRLIMGDKSQWVQDKENSSTLGAAGALAERIGLAGLGGAVSGGLMGGGGMLVSGINQQRYGRSNALDNYQEIADSIDTDPASYKTEEDAKRAQNLESLARSYAALQARGGEPTAMQQGAFMRDYYDLIPGVKDFSEDTTPAREETASAAQNNENIQDQTDIAQKTQKQETRNAYPYNPNLTDEQIQEIIAKDFADEVAAGEQENQKVAPVQQPESRIESEETRQTVPETMENVRTERSTENVDYDTLNDYAKGLGENGRKAFVENYDGNLSIDDYQTAYGRYYDAGRYNADMDTAEKSMLASMMTPEQAAAAYKAGAQDRNLAIQTQPEYRQGEARTGSAEDLTGQASAAQKALAQSLGKKTGLRFELVDSSTASGSYEAKSGVVRFNINSKNILQTASHELTHFIQDYAPTEYGAYKQMAANVLMNRDGVTADELVRNYEARYAAAGQHLSRDQIWDEIVSDGTGMMLNDENLIKQVTSENRSLAQKIVDFISDMIDSIKALISGEGISKSAKYLHENLQDFENIRDMWAHGIEEASKKYKSGQNIINDDMKKYRIERPELLTEKNIEQNYNDVRRMGSVSKISGDEYQGTAREVRSQIMDLYRSYGGKVYNDVVGDIELNGRSVRNDLGHGFSPKKAAAFASVKDVLEKGKVLRYSTNWKNRGYDAVAIGGKITIENGENAGQYYEVCIVRIDEDNRMYLHEVDVEKADSVPFNYGRQNDSHSGYDYPPISSIFEKLRSVNGANENSLRRLQLEDVDQSVESDREADQILKENKELREANEALKKQLTLTKDYVPRMEDIKRTANKLLRDYNSKYSKDTLIKNLSSLYNYMHSYEEGGYGQSMGEINRAAQAIARSIVQNASLKDEIGDEYKNVLKRIRSTKMVVPESYRTELDSEGGYDVFRKKYFGRLRLGNEGIDVDTAYEELSNLYPHLFPSDTINPADQILKIAQVYDDLSPQIKNPYHANMDEMTTIVANEIKEAAVNVRALPPTMADKMQAQIYRAQQEYRAKTEAYKARLKGEYDSDFTEVEKNAKTRRLEINRQIRDLAEQYRSYGEGSTKEEQQQIRAPKKENWRQQEELRAERKALEDKVDFDILAGKEKYQRRRDAAESRKHREKIRKDVDEMAKWLTTPTDQKHVPESLRKPLAEFLSGIDYSSNRTNSEGEATARTNKWWDLTKQFDQIAKEGVSTDDGESLYMDVDPDLAEKMATLKDQVKDFDKLENLDLKSLRTLRDVVASMKHSIQDANKVFANNSYERVDQIAKDFLKENKERATKTIYTGARGSIDSMFRSDMLDAGTMFGRMGTAMETVYREQRDGFDRKVRDTKTAQDYMANVLEEKGIDSKELQTWTGKNAEKHTFEVQGGKIDLTTAQIMSLYELNKRVAAKEHIYNKLGGIKSAPTVEYDKKSHGYVVNKSTEPVSVSALDVQKITDTLTPQQKEIADSVVKFFTTVTSQWGNEVSMDMYGYKKFNAKNYFPIVSDKNYIASRESELGSTLTTLRNMGSTKHTVPHANNPIIIEDIFDVYTRQADQMSSYHAFVRPLADLQKVLNYKELGAGSVKESIERTFGKDGLNYIKSLMIDLNGTSSSEKNFVAGLTRNMKSAAVGANLRTAIQQPTAYVRAAAEINPKYLVQGLKLHVSDAEWELCKQYAPIAQWKDWGYFDINTGRSMKSILMGPEGLKEKLVENSMWLAGKGDEIAWKRLWMACQEETQDLHPELKKGSEEYYNQCGKRFSELIDKTQVVDSVLHRSKLMKSKDGLKQMYTSFMSEPTKTYNMLYRAIGDVAVKPTKETKAKLGRVLAVYVANATATSLAAAVVDAMRNDGEDKKFLEKYEDALAENLSDNLDPVGILPVVKDIEGIFSGYSVERTDLSAFQELYYAVSKWQKKFDGESDLTYPALLIDTAKPLSTLTGMPVGNLLKDFRGLTNTIIQSIGSPELVYSKNRFYRDIESKDNISNYVALAMKQYAEGNNKMGDQIIQDLMDTDIDKIDTRIKNRYVKILKDDDRIVKATYAKVKGDYKTYEKILTEMAGDGYNSTYLQKAVDGLAKKYGEVDLENVVTAVQKGKNYEKAYQNTVNDLKADAKRIGVEFDEKNVETQLKSQLSEAYEEKYIKGTQEQRQKIRTTLYKVKINGKQLFKETDFREWIKSATDREKKSTQNDMNLFEMSDVVNAIQNGKDYTQAYKKVVESKKVETKKEGEKFDEKTVLSSLKSRLTKIYKETYVGGSQAERQKIRTTLYKVRINGKQLYSDDDFKDWIKSAKKK